jgi:hypothetical protein
MAEQNSTPMPEEHPERHEQSDVSIRGLTIFFIAFVVVAVIVHLGLWLLFDAFEQREQALDLARQQSAIPLPQPRVPVEGVWPEGVPRLQGVPSFHAATPAQDMSRMLVEDQQRLHLEHPLPNPDGTARIAIDRAMELVIQRGMLRIAPIQDAQGGKTDHEPIAR